MAKKKAKKYSKKKDVSKDPTALGPSYRTSDFIKNKKFGGPKTPAGGFNRAKFRVQHKG